MVIAMSDLPREIGNQEGRVQDQAKAVVEDSGRRKRHVTTFMGKDPDSRTEETLEKGVKCPESKTKDVGRDINCSCIIVENFVKITVSKYQIKMAPKSLLVLETQVVTHYLTCAVLNVIRNQKIRRVTYRRASRQ